MNTLQLNNRSVPVYSKWEELKLSHAKQLAPFLLGKDADSLRKRANELRIAQNPNSLSAFSVNSDFYYLRISLLLILMNLRWKFSLSMFILFRVKAEHYAQILSNAPQLIDWLYKEPCTKQLLPTMQVGLRNLIGPREYLGGILFGEFEFAQIRYTKWLKTRRREHLQMFVYSIYRCERKDVDRSSIEYHRDRRQQFNEITSDANSTKLSKVNESTLLVAVLYWQGCLAKMHKDYPFVFAGSGKKTKSNPGELILSLAGSAKKSDIIDAATSSVHAVMTKLNADNRTAIENQQK